jgi:hypothetical protein
VATAAAAACSREVMVNGEVQAVLFDSVAVTDAGSPPAPPLRSGDRGKDGSTSGLVSSSSSDVAMTIFFSRALIRPIDYNYECGLVVPILCVELGHTPNYYENRWSVDRSAPPTTSIDVRQKKISLAMVSWIHSHSPINSSLFLHSLLTGYLLLRTRTRGAGFGVSIDRSFIRYVCMRF